MTGFSGELTVTGRSKKDTVTCVFFGLEQSMGKLVRSVPRGESRDKKLNKLNAE